MTSASIEVTRSTGDLVTLLAAELSRLRVRGIDAVGRHNHKQRTLFLPELSTIIETSPWAGEPREVALRRIIRRSIQSCGSVEIRRALQALYGIEPYSELDAEERQRVGLKALRVPFMSSAEHKKQRIRDARIELARAILKAVAHGYKLTDENDVEDVAEEELSLSEGALLNLLQALSQGKGVTPPKIESDGRLLLDLEGSQHEFQRAVGGESQAECAMKFMSCVSRMPAMREPHTGQLAREVLNLNQNARDYDYRVSKYMEAAAVASIDDFRALEARALIRFTRLAHGLKRSPCFAEPDEVRKGIEFADHTFGILDQLSRETQWAAAHQFARRLKQDYPDVMFAVPRLRVAARRGPAGWLEKLIEIYSSEYEIWVNQYRERIDVQEKFLSADVLAGVLLDPLQLDGIYGKSRSTRRRKSLRRPQQASLVLFAQMLSYNRGYRYWVSGVRINDRAQAKILAFPIVPIDHFLPDRSSSRERV